MASFAINSTVTTTQNLTGTDNGILGPQGAILVNGSYGILATGTDHELAIDGTVISTDSKTIVFDAGEVDVVVGSNGSVLSTTSVALETYVSGSATITNNGTVSGEIIGIWMNGSDAYAECSLINTGTVSSCHVAVNFAVKGAWGSITNSGTIIAIGTGVYANNSTGAVDTHNSGIIQGFWAYYGSDFVDTVTNSGEMYGDVHLNSGNDVYNGLYGFAAGTIYGETGNDLIKGGAENNTLDGGGDNDTLFGFGGNDTLLGGANEDVLSGGGGNDLLQGGNGFDSLSGGDGNDALFGENGSDTLLADAGNDTLSGGTGDDELRGGANEDSLNGDHGNDSLYGGNGFDSLRGGANEDLLEGGNGDDALRGDNGRDTLFGNDGNDSLFGDNGTDTLDGGNGNDSLTGGVASDVFIFVGTFGNDTITDFDEFDDAEVIDLSSVASITNFADLTNASNPHMTQNGANVVIDDFAGNLITVLNALVEDMNEADFVFV